MDTYGFLIILSSLVIFSYLFEIFSKRTRIPSVLLLLLLGIGLRFLSEALDLPPYNFNSILPLLGTVGLILIVFEGALGLQYDPTKAKLIRSAFGAALFILIITSAIVAGIFYFFTKAPVEQCLLNAIPFSVISSSIAIPSVASLMGSKKEFIIYESSFSDILGIMVFNFILANETMNAGALGRFAFDLVILILLSLVSCFVFLVILARATHHIKFFLIISALILVYAIGKQFHLSTLVTVLAFGLFLENSKLIADKLSKLPVLDKITQYMMYEGLRSDLKNLHQLSAESAFILRTFFFLVFGYTLMMEDLMRSEVFIYGLLIMAATYAVRWAYLRLIARAYLWPELLITPRGLISVLLFLSIPESKQLTTFGSGILLFCILLSGVLMTVGLMLTGKQPMRSGDE